MANDLQELQQLLQLSNLSQQPGMEQQRLQQQQKEGNIHALLTLLGLQQQQQGQQAHLGFEREQAQQQAAHQATQDTAAQDNIKKGITIEGMKMLQEGTRGGQQVNPTVDALLGAMIPEYKQAMQDQYWKNSTDQYNQNQDAFNKIYDPVKPQVASAFGTLNHFTPDAMTWLTQNAQSQPKAPVAPGLVQQMFGSGPTAPMIGTEPREGGVLPYLKQTGVIPTLPTPEERAARSQSLWDAPDSPLSILFGRKKATPTPTPQLNR